VGNNDNVGLGNIVSAHTLFTLLEDTDIDAINWRGEQTIRRAVVNRKVWGGNRTWRGAAAQGRIMRAIRTASRASTRSTSSSGWPAPPTPAPLPLRALPNSRGHVRLSSVMRAKPFQRFGAGGSVDQSHRRCSPLPRPH